MEYKCSHFSDQSCINSSHSQTARAGGKCLSAGLLGSGSSTQLASNGRFRYDASILFNDHGDTDE